MAYHGRMLLAAAALLALVPAVLAVAAFAGGGVEPGYRPVYVYLLAYNNETLWPPPGSLGLLVTRACANDTLLAVYGWEGRPVMAVVYSARAPPPSVLEECRSTLTTCFPGASIAAEGRLSSRPTFMVQTLVKQVGELSSSVLEAGNRTPTVTVTTTVTATARPAAVEGNATPTTITTAAPRYTPAAAKQTTAAAPFTVERTVETAAAHAMTATPAAAVGEQPPRGSVGGATPFGPLERLLVTVAVASAVAAAVYLAWRMRL